MGINFYKKWDEREKFEDLMRDPAILVDEHDEKRVEDNKDACLLPKIVRGLIEKRKVVKK